MNKISNWIKVNTAGFLALCLVAAMAFYGLTGSGNTGKALGLSDLLVQSADAASVDYFLKIDDIKGESTVAGHENQIDVLSYSWGETQTGSASAGGGAGAGKVNMQDFCFTAKLSTASPALFVDTANGRHIEEATLFVVRKASKDKAQEFLKWTLKDVLVSSYQQSAGADNLVPTDSFCLNFAKLEIEYTPQKADGSLGTPIHEGWDLKENKGV